MYLFHPEESVSVVWDLFVFGLVCYVTVTTPLRISFFADLDHTSAWFWFDFGIDILFMLDIIKRFRTGYFVDDFSSDVIMSPWKIAKKYFRTWFLLDFVSCVPVDVLVLILEGDNVTHEKTDASSLIGVKRFLKILQKTYWKSEVSIPFLRRKT